MDNAGIFTLAALQISAAMSLKLLTPIPGLGGMSACNLEANFQYGAGGATCSAIVATTFDGGTTWRHIARFDFTTAAAVKTANLQALGAKGVAPYADLASEGVNDGLLGDQLAVYLVSTGSYAGTTLSVRAAVR
jgi:hypothetical protein